MIPWWGWYTNSCYKFLRYDMRLSGLLLLPDRLLPLFCFLYYSIGKWVLYSIDEEFFWCHCNKMSIWELHWVARMSITILTEPWPRATWKLSAFVPVDYEPVACVIFFLLPHFTHFQIFSLSVDCRRARPSRRDDDRQSRGSEIFSDLYWIWFDCIILFRWPPNRT